MRQVGAQRTPDKHFRSAARALNRKRSTLDPGFQSSAATAYANCLSGSGRARKHPVTAGFSAGTPDRLLPSQNLFVSLRPILSKAHDSASLVRNCAHCFDSLLGAVALRICNWSLVVWWKLKSKTDRSTPPKELGSAAEAVSGRVFGRPRGGGCPSCFVSPPSTPRALDAYASFAVTAH
jgi:hypothetical protein